MAGTKDSGAPGAPRYDGEHAWHRVFLAVLADTANVSAACAAANVGRTTARRHKDTCRPFAEAWEDAIETSVDALEEAARKRALFGVARPVYQGGEQVGSVQQFSDGLAKFLLQAYKPQRFDDKVRAAQAGMAAVQDVKVDFTGKDIPINEKLEQETDEESDQDGT